MSTARMKTLARCVVMVAAAAATTLLTACPPTNLPPLPKPSTNYKTDFRLVFPVVATKPTVDGLATDPAWSSGFRFVMEDGGSAPAATLRGLATTDSLYLYAEVEDNGFDDTDVVVIGINPDNVSSHYRRIHIFPCKPTGVCPPNGSNQIPVIEHTTGTFSGGAYTWAPANVGNGSVVVGGNTVVTARAATATGAQKKWAIELSIPRGAPYNLADTLFFGLFVDVVKTDPAAGLFGEAVQYTWPPNQFIGASENDVLADLDNTPHPDAWGNATLSNVFGNGVSIFSNDIRSNHPSDPGKIVATTPIYFYGTAANYTSSGGTLVTANAVSATFKIANNGLPALGSFANVPVAGNPTAAANIAPTAAHTFQIGPWNVTGQLQTDYLNHPDQCVTVDLSSTDPNTVFVNQHAMRNMHFVQTASPFRERAALPTRGFKRRPGLDTLAFTLRESFVNFDPSLTWRTEIGGATRVSDRVYRATARPDEDRGLDISVDPPRIKIPEDSLRVAPGTGGPNRPAVRLDVRPDELITFIASGTIQIDGQPVSAAGARIGEGRGEKLLKDSGVNRVGALLGSFDDFKETAFVIGNAATIKVPSGASALQLKINDSPEQYAKQRGEGYQLQVVRTPIDRWVLATNPDVARRVIGADVFVTLGANLPTWLLRGEMNTGQFIRIGGKSFRVYESVGSLGYIVKRIK
jgi:hypothetical protein